jgi:hypothetical protein
MDDQGGPRWVIRAHGQVKGYCDICNHHVLYTARSPRLL